MLKTSEPLVMLLDLLLLNLLQGKQSVHLTLQSSQGQEQCLLVRTHGTATVASKRALMM